MEGIEREREPKIPSAQATKAALVEGRISPEEALRTFWKIDQSFSDIPGVLHALEDKGVAEALIGSSETENYYYLLSVAALHEAGRHIQFQQDPLPLFEKSLAAARNLKDHHEAREWTLYIEAHCAYSKKDIIRLQQILDAMPKEYRNYRLVALLHKGLVERGVPDYHADLQPLKSK